MDKNIKIVLGVVLILIIGWIGYRYSVPGVEYSTPTGKDYVPAPKDSTVLVPSEPIKIGLTMPMSGEAASWGEGGRAGAELALKEINSKGGINGGKIELIYEDDKCNKDGVNSINKLANIDKVVAIIGPFCSAAGGPGLPIAQNAGVPVIFSASAPHLTKIGDYVFRAYPSDAFQGKFAANYVFNNLKKSKVALLYVKNDWGQGIRDVFFKRFTELGGNIVYDEGIAQDTKDLKSFITKMKAAEPDLVYFPAYPAVGIIGLKQMKDLGFNVPVLGGDAFETNEVFNSGVAEGVMYTVGVIKNPDDFKARVKAETGSESNIATVIVYDGVKILAKIIDAVGADRKNIRDALAKLSYKEGVSLPLIEFGHDHELTEAQFEVKLIKNGKPEVMR